MANIKSQIKRNKQAAAANARNSAAKSKVRTAIKKVKEAVKANDVELAKKALSEAYVLIDKSVSDHVQHENTAARQKASIAKLVNSIAK